MLVIFDGEVTTGGPAEAKIAENNQYNNIQQSCILKGCCLYDLKAKLHKLRKSTITW